MIRKLKRKFTILATISMLVLMAVLVTIMNIVNYSSVVSESDATLDVLIQAGEKIFDNKTFPEKPFGQNDFFIPRGMSPEVPYESRFFTVTVNSNNEIKESNINNIISVNSDSAIEYAKKAITQKGERGFVDGFRYVKISENGNTRIVFLDCGRKLDTFYTFLWTSLVVGLSGCVLVFVAFLFFSGKIVKPIAESYEKQKRFISDAGHEIKTPLTIINANVDLLSCDGEGETEELGEIRQQTKHLTELTNNLVYLSKMEETEHKIQKIELPVSDIVSETANSFSAPAQASNIAINADILPDLTLTGSPNDIRRLVSILMENALKYSPSGSRVDVVLSKNTKKKAIVLSVCNKTKIPIEEKELANVFERFYRTDTSRNSLTGGHGIGLSIAKAITEAHSGTICAATQTGNDFCVTVTLPM